MKKFIKKILDREQKIATLKKENEKIKPLETEIENLNKVKDALGEMYKKDVGAVRIENEKLKSENRVLAGNHLLDWRPFLESEAAEKLVQIDGIPTTLSDLQMEVLKLDECGFAPELLGKMVELGVGEYFEQFKKLCYLIAMKGRLSGKGEEYGESLIKLLCICKELHRTKGTK